MPKFVLGIVDICVSVCVSEFYKVKIMASVNRLIVCLRCTASRLSVADVVLKTTKCRLLPGLLADTRSAMSSASWPVVARALTSQCGHSWQPTQVRAYRTARPDTSAAAGFTQNVYDENEFDIEVPALIHGTFVTENFPFRERGTFILGNFRFLELSFPDTDITQPLILT